MKFLPFHVIFFLLAFLAGTFVRAEESSPLIPMGAITGRPTEADVVKTLEAYHGVGVDNYLIYARSGLEYPYMGEEWLTMCEQFCKHAKRLGMKIWLYDEYNWPSGTCGGQVVEGHPEFRYQEYAVSAKSDGSFAWEVVANNPQKYESGPVVGADNFDPAATKRFMELTHAKYEARLKPYFGTTIVGIFSDEPAHPFNIPTPYKAELKIRWFPSLDADYAKRTGRDFKKDVEAFLRDKTLDRVWVDYYALLGDQFRAAFFDPLRAWAERMGIALTGHMISENSPKDCTSCNGAPLHVLPGFSLPGMDEINTRWQPAAIEWDTFALARYGIDRRGRGGLVEAFALGPCDTPLAVNKQMFWQVAFSGIDHVVLAVCPLDIKGTWEKPGFFNTFTPTQPWFPALRLLQEEAKTAARFARKRVRFPVALRYPQEAIARLTGRGKSLGLLPQTIQAFRCGQMPVELIDENEPTDRPLVFSFAGMKLLEGRSGKVFETPEEALAYARKTVPPAVWFTNPDGTPTMDILCQSYTDNSFAAVLLSGLPHSLLLHHGKEAKRIDLPSHGVYWEENGQTSQPETAPAQSREMAEAEWRLAYSDPTALRLVFHSNSVARVRVEKRMESLRLAARAWPEAVSVTLDGQKVALDKPCAELRQGIANLYRASEPFALEAGEHTLTLSGGTDDHFFLAAAYLTGVFGVKDGAITERPQTARAGTALDQLGLGSYAGKVTYTASVDVPENARAIRLSTGGLVTSVAFAGGDAGLRAWSPFEWAVPENARGRRVEMSVTLYTSIGPVFGSPKALDSAWGRFWIDPIDTKPGSVGWIGKTEWLQ